MAYSFLDMAEEVLKKERAPLTFQQLWEKAESSGVAAKVGTKGKTPWDSLGSRLYVDVRDNADSNFIKVGKRPARFFLKSREDEVSEALVQKIEIEEAKKPAPKTAYNERDLHALLTYFVYASPTFSRGRSICTKTIFHETSKRASFPHHLASFPRKRESSRCGMAPRTCPGFPLARERRMGSDSLHDPRGNEYRPGMKYNNSIRLFSFELKKSVTKATYRESFFQAVSNSSWAHEGYLVAAHITEDDDLLAELERLCASFGIGIISLDVTDFDSSRVLFPARSRDILDWETVNKLCEQNKDFKKFIKDVKIDFDSKRFHPDDYDPVIKDPAKYIKDKLKIDQAD